MSLEDSLIEEVEKTIDAEDDSVRSKVSNEDSGSLDFEASKDGRYAKIVLKPGYADRSTFLLEAYKNDERVARVVRPDELRIFTSNFDVQDLIKEVVAEIQ